jgi:hypothetical protein
MSIIVLAVVVSATAASLPLVIPIAGFTFSGFLAKHVIDTVGWDGLINRTKTLPEVKAFLEKYPATRAEPNTDFHIGILYAVTECELTGELCNTAQPYVAYLEVIMDNWFGYPERIKFACHYDSSLTSYPLGDDGLIERISTCR